MPRSNVMYSSACILMVFRFLRIFAKVQLTQHIQHTIILQTTRASKIVDVMFLVNGISEEVCLKSYLAM